MNYSSSVKLDIIILIEMKERLHIYMDVDIIPALKRITILGILLPNKKPRDTMLF